MFEYFLKKIGIDNLDEALELVWHVFQKFDAPEYSDEGIESFKKAIDRKSIEAKPICGDIDIISCWDNGKIVGVLALRKPCHIFLMFVDEKYHRKGIAKNLLLEIIKEHRCTEITVNSSPYAVEVYKKLGFRKLNEEQIVDGIRFIPMKWHKNSDNIYKI